MIPPNDEWGSMKVTLTWSSALKIAIAVAIANIIAVPIAVIGIVALIGEI
tara:strand:- start:337 stop:486 length:150 start_codon:yes stop_codon:yes gene_type:complete